MLLRYFYNEKLAHASYLVGCQGCGEAIVIDPARDIEPYLQVAQAEDVKIVAAADTHIHADYVSGALELAVRVGATLYLSGEGKDETSKYHFKEQVKWVPVKDGDLFNIGNLRFEVMHTPGHTPEHVSYVLTDYGNDRPMGVFTGDFVFVGDVGRPDLLEKALGVSGSSEVGARQMFRSLQRFRELPDYLQVWPAHGAGSACGKALGAVPSSTVGYEKLFNWALQVENEEEFVRKLLDGQPEPPKYFAVMKRVNKEGPTPLSQMSDLKGEEADLTAIQKRLDQGAIILDTRPAERFAAGHVSGTINIPYNRSFTNWAGWLIDYDRSLYLIADPAQTGEILRDLRSIGIDRVDGIFDVSLIHRLQADGTPLETYERMTPREVADKVKRGEMEMVDVRREDEWKEGHIPDSRRILLGYLPDRIEEISREKPVLVICRTGARSAIACSILQAKGVSRVVNLEGGFLKWKEESLPLVKEEKMSGVN